MDADPTTEELELAQLQREKTERTAAAHTDEPDAEDAHVRRADKAQYLRERLAERAESERED